MSTSILFLIYLILALFGFLFGCAPAPEKPAARQRQMYGLVQKFDRFDQNGDGYLTRQEIAAGLKEAGTLRLSPAELDQVMTSYDTNGDRRISQREAQAGADHGPQIFEAP
ncbi:MAG: EF-hand domain-containing protein [Verrucomicrobia bacterium]|nr:EF-hand domain-containing protein [Verrucomicrobiota bacterium]